MVASSVVQFCNGTETVTSILSKTPSKAPYTVPAELFPKPNAVKRLFKRQEIKRDLHHGHGELTKEELDRAASCGKFDKRPSDLFLKIFADCLLCLERDPMCGMVSPPLIASTGTIPLSIVSVIPDIMRHYADVIVRAEYEVLLATNFWQPSHSVTIVSDALRELSKRAAKMDGGKGRKIIVKLMYDRGTLEQFVNNHSVVPPSGWKKVSLPSEDEIPNLHMEVINFHRPLLGTFHSKYLVVDRKVALLSSNNIQDRPNVEMMIHLEGPIVDSFFDMALISWHNALDPPVPSLTAHLPVTNPRDPQTPYKFGTDNPYIACKDIEGAAKRARGELKRQHTELMEEEKKWQQRPTTRRRASELWDTVADALRPTSAQDSGSHPRSWLHNQIHPHHNVLENGYAAPPSRVASTDNVASPISAGASGPSVPHSQHWETIKEVVVDGSIQAQGNGGNKDGLPNGHASPAPPILGGDYLSSPNGSTGEHHPHFASEAEVIPTSNGDANGKVKAVIEESASGHQAKPMVMDNGVQRATSPQTKWPIPLHRDPSEVEKVAVVDTEDPSGKSTKSGGLSGITAHLNTATNSKVVATAEESDDMEPFRPHILHAPHDPFPIAMVNRRPHGAPGHKDIRTPQNAAWLGAFRYAQRKVFIQTPTFNASPVVPAAMAACRRGVEVILYLDLGFNDQGEQIPFQGGTNEQVVFRMFKVLKEEGKGHENNLKVYWYTGKDQNRPLNARTKERNCHVKFCAVDDEVAIVGNGNQDTQSWFHSQEINVLVDSRSVIKEWMDGLNMNQNTLKHGRVGNDGIWRYQDGRPLETLGDLHGGTMARLKGLQSAIARARG